MLSPNFFAAKRPSGKREGETDAPLESTLVSDPGRDLEQVQAKKENR
jgi:hypothetical protein